MNIEFPLLGIDFYKLISPILILSVGAMLSLMQSVIGALSSPKKIASVTFFILLLATAASFCNLNQPSKIFLDGTVLQENLGVLCSCFILLISLCTSVFFLHSSAWQKFFQGEIVAIYQMVIIGMLVMVGSEEFVTIFVGLELASIGLYALIGYIQPTRQSQEGALKYFILGSFASAFLLFGIALFFASTGSMRISEIGMSLVKTGNHPWLLLGGVLFSLGVAFKLALVPFHMWSPDAYEGAPTALTAFMATAVKVMVFAVAIRFCGLGVNLGEVNGVIIQCFIVLASLSMIVANILGLVQASVKRMLAYSSISHSGFMTIALCVLTRGSASEFSIEMLLFYLMSYIIATLGMFAILIWLEDEKHQNLTIEDFSGLAAAHPWVSFCLTVFLLSFAGIPPTVGFLAKFFIFSGAVSHQMYVLCFCGILGSTIALYYYLRLVVKMYMSEARKDGFLARKVPAKTSIVLSLVVGVSLVVIVFSTVFPQPLREVAKVAARSFVAKQ